MRSRGFDAEPVSERIEAIAHDDWRAKNPRDGLAHAVRVFGARAEFDGPDLRGAISMERPDALIVDINSWGALAAAEAWGGPWAAFCPYPLALRSRDVPPFGPGLAPARGPLGRWRDRLLRPLVLGTVEKIMLPPLNGVRNAISLAPLRQFDDLFGRPPLILYMTAEPFEYPRSDWPDNVLMVGPCEWSPAAEVPEWLNEITDPIVLVTTSSEFQDDGGSSKQLWRGLPTSRSLWWRRCLQATPVGSIRRQTRTSSGSSHTQRCLTAPFARLPTAGWGQHRKRWLAACRYASSRSGATSSRLRDGWRWPVPVLACPPNGCGPTGCAPRFAKQ
jgi:hypothetical protein